MTTALVTLVMVAPAALYVWLRVAGARNSPYGDVEHTHANSNCGTFDLGLGDRPYGDDIAEVCTSSGFSETHGDVAHAHA